MSSVRRLMLFVILTASIFISNVQPAMAVTVKAPSVSAAARSDCYSAIARYWPTHLQPWARKIVWRESRNTPSAANPRSSARGCFQMLLRYSSPFYRAVGCNNYMWSNATCNVRAAYQLYKKAGKSPWRMY